MIKRHFSDRFHSLLKRFPLISILGPRQCGKTSFARASLPDWHYLDMEKPSDAVLLSQDPEAGLRRLKKRFILDEAQQIPDLFPVLRSWIDEKRKSKGLAVLLGSASPALIKQISESLAGRTAFLDMTPFIWDEVKSSKKGRRFHDLWFRGGFPDAFLTASHKSRRDWFEAYSRTFLYQDLSALQIEVSAPQMMKLWAMLAHVHGGLWNASQLAASLGISYHTVSRYTDILEQTFLIRKLQPYHANIGKRIVKSPKIYFRDTGLLHYFLGLQNPRDLETHPCRGASWEGFIIDQLIAQAQLFYPGTQAYFWRTSAGAEADLLLQIKGRLIPIEIKLHSSPVKGQVRGLLECMKDLGLRKGTVIYPGSKEYSLGNGIRVVPAEQLTADPAELSRL